MSRLSVLLTLLLLVPTAGAAEAPEARSEFEPPNRTHYLLGPSAMMLREGEGTISQMELLYTSLAHGLTDNLSVSVGASLPVVLIDVLENLEQGGIHFVPGIKVGGSPLERLHVAVGATFVLLPRDSYAFSYGSVTYGTSDAHVTLTLGVPMDITDSERRRLSAMPMVGGSLRLSSGLAVMGELAWWTPDSMLTGGAGLRLFNERWNVDFGLMRPPSRVFGKELPYRGLLLLPWASVSYRWG